MNGRHILGVSLAVASTGGLITPARAQESSQPAPASPPLGSAPRALAGPEKLEMRPHGVAEFGVGLLTLPGAEVCVDPSVGCLQGDTSVEVNAWQLFRLDQEVAFGAGITLALLPTTDAPRDDPPGLPRDHQRRYFTAEATARYYPISSPGFESWLGVTGGLVVVSDSFETKSGYQRDVALVGPQGVTIRTEGFTAGIAGGAGWLVGRDLYLGGSLRIANWFLPGTPARDPLGDEASLSGRVTLFDLGLSVSYRLVL